MTQNGNSNGAATKGGQGDNGLHQVLEAAQRFLACRERAGAIGPRPEARPVRTLAEAIERDFLGFDLERAEADLREAVAALCGDPARAPVSAAVRLPMPQALGRSGERRSDGRI